MTRASAASDTASPLFKITSSQDMPRRSFLGGLVKLSMVGGGVSLIGHPTAVAEPVTPALLEAYKTWLEYERRWLTWEMAADPVHQIRYRSFGDTSDRVGLSKAIDGCLAFVGQSGSYHGREHSKSPYERAALVLSTVGCDWHDRQGSFR